MTPLTTTRADDDAYGGVRGDAVHAGDGFGGFGTLSFSLYDATDTNPATLPTGLSFNTTTGEISGTPTVLLAATTFAVRVTDQTTPTAQTSSKTFQLTVDAVALTTTQAVPTTTLTEGTAATPFTPVTASGGFGTLTFALSDRPAPTRRACRRGSASDHDRSDHRHTDGAAGDDAVTVKVTDQTTPTAQTSSKTFELTVDAVALATTQAVATTTLRRDGGDAVHAGDGFGWVRDAELRALRRHRHQPGDPPDGAQLLLRDWRDQRDANGAAGGDDLCGRVTDQTTPTAQTSSKTFALTVDAVTLATIPGRGNDDADGGNRGDAVHAGDGLGRVRDADLRSLRRHRHQPGDPPDRAQLLDDDRTDHRDADGAAGGNHPCRS